MYKFIGITFTIILSCLLSGCAPKLYLPAERHVTWAKQTFQYESTVESFEHARTMYTHYCQACHDLHMPSEYSIAEWGPIYHKMSANITLADSSKQKIYYYIIAGANDAQLPKN